MYLSTLTNLLMFPLALLLLLFSCLSYLYLLMLFNPKKKKSVWFRAGKVLITQCDCIWLFTIVEKGITRYNFCKIFSYRVKRDWYENFIGIRELSEWLALYWFKNIFTTDTGTQEKYFFLMRFMTERQFILTVKSILTLMFLVTHSWYFFLTLH